MGLHNPLPSSMASECKKCGKILTSFIDPRQAFSPDKIIPPSVLANAKGLAILTVLKAGFLGSGRFGSGLTVARLPDGSWSAPSAIGTAGAGFGGQIGFELTDFVFILNDASAVKTFAQAGSLTLGGNVSIAAGPVGRNAEAAGAASLKSVAGIFAYSKTKGLFAGVSLEGSVIIERRDANEKLYGTRYTAAQILTGSVRPPPQAAPLMNILNSRSFNAGRTGQANDAMYNDVPVYEEGHDNVVWNGRQGTGLGEGDMNHRSSVFGPGHGPNGGADGASEFGGPKRSSTWQDDVYDRQSNGGFAGVPRSNTGVSRANTGVSRSNTFASRGNHNDNYVYRDNPSPNFVSDQKTGAPGRPAAPKPNFASKTAMLKKNEAVALFTFDADQPGDLGFKKGDVITVLKRTDSESDWWTGMIGTRHGIFPSNYVKMRE